MSKNKVLWFICRSVSSRENRFNNQILLKLTILISLYVTVDAFGQGLNPCHYFYLDVNELTYDGNKSLSFSPEVRFTEHDEFSEFAERHSNRFYYLLWHQIDDLASIAEQYPDAALIDSLFCQKMSNNEAFLDCLNSIVPEQYCLNNTSIDTFSVDELMLVASRFFYCEEISEDAAVVRRICVGISGQDEIDSTKDYCALQAFAFEAIFHYLIRNDRLDKKFNEAVSISLSKHKGIAEDLDELLEIVRKESYGSMQGDAKLQRDLLRYYKKNKENVSFEIINGS